MRKFWWTRTQRIRTVATVPVELVLLDAVSRLGRVSARPDVPEDIHIPR